MQTAEFFSLTKTTGPRLCPAGWCDVDQSIASNMEKEVREEAGFEVTAERLIAVRTGGLSTGLPRNSPFLTLNALLYTNLIVSAIKICAI